MHYDARFHKKKKKERKEDVKIHNNASPSLFNMHEEVESFFFPNWIIRGYVKYVH